MILLTVLYFFLGLILDILNAIYVNRVSYDRERSASFVSFLLTLFGLFVISSVIVSQEWIMVFAYAVGTGAGTCYGMRLVRPKSLNNGQDCRGEGLDL